MSVNIPSFALKNRQISVNIDSLKRVLYSSQVKFLSARFIGMAPPNSKPARGQGDEARTTRKVKGVERFPLPMIQDPMDFHNRIT